MAPSSLVISIDAAPASDGWGFVGRVLVGDMEAYRSIRAYTTPSEALDATSQILAGALGPLLAGQEWNMTTSTLGHAALRTDLGFGLTSHRGHATGLSTGTEHAQEH
jgi:hypothetical protein